MDTEKIQKCEDALNFTFKNKELLSTALTHSSFAKQKRQTNIQDNERLEFLGDAVLKLAISAYLYQKFPSYSEGQLTKIRAKLVSDKNLAIIAKKFKLGDYIKFSFGERNTGGNLKTSNLANVFEALLGASFIDQDFNASYHFFYQTMDPLYDTLVSEETLEDYKTQLQEFLQRNKLSLPMYKLLLVEGPDHQKQFIIEVQIKWGNTLLHYTGKGISKKTAEQAAAKEALSDLITPKT